MAEESLGPGLQAQLEEMKLQLNSLSNEQLINIILEFRIKQIGQSSPQQQSDLNAAMKLDALRIAKEIELQNFRIKPISETKELSIEDVMAKANVILNYIENK